MRNIFDQYRQPENRLTHALASGLANDPRLLKRFLVEVAGCTRPLPKKLRVEEQRLPGEPLMTEEEAERRGLPDVWIHDDDRWSLLIESKVASKVSTDQLRRHMRTAERRGFDDLSLLVLAIEETARLPDRSRAVAWSSVYSWLRSQRDSEWAARISEYMEISEGHMVDEGYLGEGTLTEFSGFPFGRDHEYNYPEAKRVLRLAMAELRKRRELERELGAALKSEGRSAIKGRGQAGVWDFIALKQASGDETFTKHPHLTLSLGRDRVLAQITFPHSMRTEYRRKLIAVGEDGFFDLVLEVERNLRRVLCGIPDAQPWFNAIQRHYRSQSSPATIDALLEFDLRTALPRKDPGRISKVKSQSQWLGAAFDVLAHRRSNYQPAIGAIFPYSDKSKISEKGAIGLIAGTWIACKPVLWAALGAS